MLMESCDCMLAWINNRLKNDDDDDDDDDDGIDKISSCYHMVASAIWYLFFEFPTYCTSAKRECNKRKREK